MLYLHILIIIIRRTLMQVVIVTLHNVELLNQENKLQKISISLLFG